MDFFNFVRLAKVYNNMGSAVQTQMDHVVDGEDLNALNPNALKMIRELVQKLKNNGIEDDLDIIGDITEHLGGR
jgi:hypothetical protein